MWPRVRQSVIEPRMADQVFDHSLAHEQFAALYAWGALDDETTAAFEPHLKAGPRLPVDRGSAPANARVLEFPCAGDRPAGRLQIASIGPGLFGRKWGALVEWQRRGPHTNRAGWRRGLRRWPRWFVYSSGPALWQASRSRSAKSCCQFLLKGLPARCIRPSAPSVSGHVCH